MAGHKYRVGQHLTFRPARMSSIMGPQACTIVRQLPVEGGNRLYRIKCALENGERVVKESELAPRIVAA